MKSTKSLFRNILCSASAIVVCTASFAQYLPSKPNVKLPEEMTATGIIKSKSKSGKIMYSDHPVAGFSMDKKLVGKTFVAPAKVVDEVKEVKEETLPGSSAKSENQIEVANKKIEEANVKIKKENCDNAKMSLSTLVKGARVARMKADGTKEYLSEAAIDADREKTLAVIKDNCR